MRIIRKHAKTLIVFCLFITSVMNLVYAEASLELEAAEIVGNRELPRTMSIVPWKKSLYGDLHDWNVESNLEINYGLLDNDFIRREIEYYNAINMLR